MEEDEVLNYGRSATDDPALRLKQNSDQIVDAGKAANKSGKGRPKEDPSDGAPQISKFCASPRDPGFFLTRRNAGEYRKLLGTIAERLVFVDFCSQHNCNEWTPPANLGHDFLDAFNSNKSLAAYYRHHNVHITGEIEKSMTKRGSGIRRPDIVRHTDAIRQYYEIKPQSVSGRKQGRDKLKALNKFYKRFNLPYTPGTFYSPPKSIWMGTARFEGLDIKLSLELFEIQAGLITYHFCIEGELEEASKRFWNRIRLIGLLIILIGIISPIEDPIEVPDRDGPLPMPAPATSGKVFTIPRLYSGPVEVGPDFHYKRGLSRKNKIGDTVLITLALYKPNGPYLTALEFCVKARPKNKTVIESTNKKVLNVAPLGEDPFLINPNTRMSIDWHPGP